MWRRFPRRRWRRSSPRQVGEAGGVFEVADGEFDAGVLAVVGVGGDGVLCGVGGEGVVAPVRPQRRLGGVGEAAAAHDEAHAAAVAAFAGGEGGLSDVRFAALGIRNGRPVGFGNGGNGGFDVAIQGDRDRPAHPQGVEAVEEFVAPEPRVGAHSQCAGGAGAPGAGDGFGDEMGLAALGGPLAQAGGRHLAGLGAGRHEGVIAQLAGVAVGGAGFLLAGDRADRRIHVDGHRIVAGAAAGRPRPPQHLTGRPIQLAHMAPRKGPQERSRRRRRRRLEPQHGAGRPGA